MNALSEMVLSKLHGGILTKALPVDGPTSFTELEADQAAKKKADEIQLLGMNFQRLTSNILGSVDPASTAQELRRLSAELSQRINETVQENPKANGKSLSDLVVERMNIAVEPKVKTLLVPEELSLGERLFPSRKNKSLPQMVPPSGLERRIAGILRPLEFLEHRKELARSAAVKAALVADFQKMVDAFSREASAQIKSGQAFDGKDSFGRLAGKFVDDAKALIGQ